MPNVQNFQTVQALRPGRSVFDLSYDKKLTCDMGELIPVLCEMAIPGDHWTVGNSVVARLQPLLAPIMHEINIYVHYFFVPLRILESESLDWYSEDWENFITGGEDGDWAVKELPRWSPVSGGPALSEGTLWDYFGFPLVSPAGCSPVIFPLMAYHAIYNDYYRDENLQDKIALPGNTVVKKRNWEKDYFTSALPWQQRGTAPSLPIAGTTKAVWPDGDFVADGVAVTGGWLGATASHKEMHFAAGSGMGNAKLFFADNSVDLSLATTFDIADLRLCVQLQKWLERNARGGARYTENLKAHFGESPRDERLQRPEYIGGTKSPIIISEVLQTSEEGTTPQGNLAGHGISANRQFAGSYHVQEHGIIMGIMSIMPRTAYQQGMDRQWLQVTREDFYWPEFAHLSEQAIVKGEIAAKDNDATHNQTVFGYQGRYDEYRTKKSMVCGQMRSTLDYWHLGRKFADVSTVELNSSFVTCDPSKRIFAVQDEDGFIINFGNIVRAVRPMPIKAEPGLMDHF